MKAATRPSTSASWSRRPSSPPTWPPSPCRSPTITSTRASGSAACPTTRRCWKRSRTTRPCCSSWPRSTRRRRISTWPSSPWTACWRSSPATRSWRAEKKRIRDRFQELTLPEKFKTHILQDRDQPRGAGGADRLLFRAPYRAGPRPRDPHRHRRLVRQGADHQDRHRRHHARPPRPHLRALRRSRPRRFAVTLQALIDYLKGKGHVLRFTPLSPRRSSPTCRRCTRTIEAIILPGQFPGAGRSTPRATSTPPGPSPPPTSSTP